MNDKKYRNNVGLWKIGHFVQNYKILAKVVNPNLLAIVICFLAIFYISSLNFAFGQDNVSNKEGFVEIGKLLQPRKQPSAVVLDDGRIFIAGGGDENNHSLNTTEIFDPKTGKSIYGPNLGLDYFNHPIFLYLLNNGNVLIASSNSPADDYNQKIEIYNPNKNIIENSFDFKMELISFDGYSYVLPINNNEVLIIPKMFKFKNSILYNIKKNNISKKYVKLFDDNDFEKKFLTRLTPQQYYVTKKNNYFYLIDAGDNIIKISDDFNNIEYKKIKDKNSMSQLVRAIFLKNKNIIVIFDHKSIYYFDVKSETYQKIINFGNNHYKTPFRRLFEKSNGNILFFEFCHPGLYEYIYEFDIEKKEIISKNYHTPTRFSDIVQSDKGDIYSIGGERINEVFMHHSLSNKVYLLKQ